MLYVVPAFSLAREVTVFAIFVGVVIFLTICVEIEYKRSIEKAKKNEANHTNLFTKIEEFRNDFDDDRQAG